MTSVSSSDRYAAINATFARIAAESVPVVAGAASIADLRIARRNATDALLGAPSSMSCMEAFNAALNAISDASMSRHRALRIEVTQGDSV